MDRDLKTNKQVKKLKSNENKNNERKKTSRDSKKRKDNPQPDVEPWKRTIKATIADIRKDKYFYILYFEDEDIGLGAFEEETMLLDGLHKWLFVTFTDENTAQRALTMNHVTEDSNIVKVKLATPKDFNTYPNLLFLYGFDNDFTALSELILEKTRMEIVDIETQDEPRAVIITFDEETCIDITALAWALTKLNNKEMITAPVYRESSILVSGLNENIPQAHLERYMKNKKRSGGGPIECIKYLNTEEAIITFENEADLNDVLKHKVQLAIGKQQLTISPIYSCLTKQYLVQFISNVRPELVTKSSSHSAGIKSQIQNRTQREKFLMSENLNLKEEEMFVLDKCDFISNMRDKNKSVRIIFDQENKTFVIKGNTKSEITEVQLEILQMCQNKMEEKSLSHWTPEQCQFIGQKDVLLKLNSMLPNAYLMSSKTGFKIIYLKSEDPKNLTSIIDSQTCLNKKSLTLDMVTILLSGKGQKFLSDLMVDPSDNSLCPVLKVDTTSQSLIMLGPKDVMFNLEKEVDRFLDVNKVITKEIPFSQGKLKYMKQYLQKEFNNVNENVGTDLDIEHVSNKFIIRGLKDLVDETNRRLTLLSEQILNEELRLDFHGIKDFLQEQECSNKMKEIEMKNNCVVCNSLMSTALTEPQTFTLKANTKIDEAVILRLLEGNIIELKINAVIDPLTSKLQINQVNSLPKMTEDSEIISSENTQKADGNTVSASNIDLTINWENIIKEQKEELSKNVVLTIYSQNERNIKDASSEIMSFCIKHYKEFSEEDNPTITKLSEYQVKEVEQFGVQEGIKVTILADEGFVKMEGFNYEKMLLVQNKLQKCIVEAVENHHQLLHKSMTQSMEKQEQKSKNFKSGLESTKVSTVSESFLGPDRVVRIIPFSKGKQKFLKKYQMINSEKDFSMTFLSDKCIIKGLKELVDLCEDSMKKILTIHMKLKFIGIKEFFQDAEGKNVLKAIEDSNRCIIWLNSLDGQKPDATNSTADISKDNISEEVNLIIYSDDAQEMVLAKKKLKDLCKLAYKEEKLKEDNLSLLALCQIQDLQHTGLLHKVKVITGENAIIIQGFKTDGFSVIKRKLKTLVSKHLDQLFDAALSNVEWQFKQGDRWRPFHHS